MRPKLTQIADFVVIVAGVLISILVGLRLWDGSAGSSNRVPRPTVENLEKADIVVSVQDAIYLGSASTKFVLLEFSDYECPFCSRYTLNTYPELKTKFVDTGKLGYAFRNLPLPIHQRAVDAATAAQCANQQGRFWEMHRTLFANQKALSDADLARYADALGLDTSKFGECLTGSAPERIKADQTEAQRLGITSTPTFIVGTLQPNKRIKALRKVNGAQPYSVFEAVLQEIGI